MCVPHVTGVTYSCSRVPLDVGVWIFHYFVNELRIKNHFTKCLMIPRFPHAFMKRVAGFLLNDAV